jgi:hypothetical protein
LTTYNVNDRMINDCGAAGGMRIGGGNRNTRGELTLVTLCPPQIPRALTWHRKLANNRLSYRTADFLHKIAWFT